MYDDDKFIKKHDYKISYNDINHDKFKKAKKLTGKQGATLAHDLTLIALDLELYDVEKFNKVLRFFEEQNNAQKAA